MKKILRKILPWLAAALGLFLLLLPKTGAWWRPHPAGGKTEARGDARRSGTGVEVETIRLKPVMLDETLTLSGTLRADETIDVQTETAGKIVALSFAESSPVRRGDLLVKITDAELLAALQRAQARRELAQLKQRRLGRLFDSGAITQQDYDTAQNEFTVQEAEVQLIRAQLDKTEIRAPFDGVIGLRFVSAGSLVTPATRIATLQSIAQLKLDFPVPERHAARLRPGARVEFTVSGDNRRHPGEVYAVEPRIDEATRTVLVRARVDNSDGTLRPGALAEVTLALQHWPDALLVPAMAVVTDARGKTVFVVEKDLAVVRQVETGLRRQELVQIVTGLKPGDQLIVAGVQQVKAGTAVHSAKAE